MPIKKLYCIQNTKRRIRQNKIVQISSFNIFVLGIIAFWYIKLPYIIKNIYCYCSIIVPSRLSSCLIFNIISFQKLINLISGFFLYG